uniref:C2H2-type domain-containing protein n=1 Tax=Oryza brachyantha TaxID=4533 RepID=J3L6L6_ORYBR
MEGGSSSGSGRRRREEEEIEEGEIRRCGGAGGDGWYDSGSESEDEEGRFVFQPRRGEEVEEEGEHAVCKRRRVEDVIAEIQEVLVALPSPTPSSGSEATGSDDGAGGAAAAAPSDAAPQVFLCNLCGREFGSRKAVYGHKRVHQAEKEKE